MYHAFRCENTINRKLSGTNLTATIGKPCITFALAIYDFDALEQQLLQTVRGMNSWRTNTALLNRLSGYHAAPVLLKEKKDGFLIAVSHEQHF